MTAFDTDVLSDTVKGRPDYLVRLSSIPAYEQLVPIVVIEQIIRGWLNLIRKIQTRKSKSTMPWVYENLDLSLRTVFRMQTLPYTDAVEVEFLKLDAILNIGSDDLRIAATAIVHGAKLVTRNSKDFSQVPGLNLEVWP